MDHTSSVYATAWSPDGKYVASTSDDATARVWDTATWRLVRTFDRGSTLKQGLAWSPDSTRLAWGSAADDNAVYLWRVGTDEVKVLNGHTSSVWTLAWRPDGKRLASSGMDETVRIWNPETAACERVVPDAGGYSIAVAWSPDGKRFASSKWRRGLRVWDANSWEVARDHAPGDNSRSLAWHPDGTQLASGTETGGCVLYRADDWSEIRRWTAHLGGTFGVSWSPDGKRLASSGEDCLVKVWTPDGRCDRMFRGHRNTVNSVGWEPGGGRLVSASMDSTVKIWSLTAPPQPVRLDAGKGFPPGIVWGDDGRTLQTLDPGGGSVAKWDPAMGHANAKVKVPAGRFGDFLRDGSVAIGQSEAGAHHLLVHDPRTGSSRRVAVAAPTRAVVLNPRGPLLAILGDSKLEVIDPVRKEVVFRHDGNWLRAIDWSPDGRLLAATGDGDESDDGYVRYAGWVHVFDIGQRKRVLKVRLGAERVAATAVAWSPDGKRLVGGDLNGLVEILEVPGGRKTLSASLHTARVTALAWSPDGRRVASASRDRTVRVWDPAVGEELLRFDTPDAVVARLRWSADGRRLAAAGEDGAVLVWDAGPGYAYVDSPQYAWGQTRSLSADVRALQDRGQIAEQVPLLKRIVERLNVVPGPDHDETLTFTNNLAVALLNLGRFDEAIQLVEPNLNRFRAARGPDHETILKLTMRLADAHDKLGRPDSAEPFWRDLIDRHRRVDGPTAPATANILALFGTALLGRKKFVEAEPVLRECLAIREAKIPNDWLRFNAMSLVGGALLGQKKYVEAEPLLVQGYEGVKKRETAIPPTAKFRLGEAATRLADLYDATGRQEKAVELRERAEKTKPDP